MALVRTVSSPVARIARSIIDRLLGVPQRLHLADQSGSSVVNLLGERFGLAEGQKHAVRKMLQGAVERLRRAVERPADESHAKLAAFHEREFLLEVRLAAKGARISAAEDSEPARIRDGCRQASARNQRHRGAENRMPNSELLGQPRFHNCCPFRKCRRGARQQTGMGWGPPEGRTSFGSVRDCTCSRVASGASSRRSKPCGVTSMTASSVTMWSTTSTPVRGSVHFFRILGLLSRVACSMAMNTRFAPATRSMAPPMPLSILPGMAQLASVPFSSTCSAPRTVRSMWPPRIMANESAEEK